MTAPDPNDDVALEPLLQAAVRELQMPVAASVTARAALVAALADAAAASQPPAVTAGLTASSATATVIPLASARARRGAGWFTDARALRLSPLGALAAASLLIAATAAVTARVVRTATPAVTVGPVVAAPPAGVQVVRFSLAAPQARRVSLVGDFNGWDPAATALQERDGTWTVVIPVTPGRHQYGFVIDGTEWIADPQAARTSDADFGTANSVVYVGS